MRFENLRLVRFGHFTDFTLEFPQSENDFHLVYGRNEAGKSTVRQAIEDFLFGIPPRSGYDFLHSYSDLQIGAKICNGDRILDLSRFKGNINTLKNHDRSPIEGADAALAQFLANADHEFFLRMFSLDRQRLGEGGASILNADDDIGKEIFAATTGLSGLREKAIAWEEEADGYWAPRKAAKRTYYSAHDRFNHAKREIREISISVKQWEEAKSKFDETQTEIERLKDEMAEHRPRLRKIQRVIRTKQNVNRAHEIQQQLDEIGSVIDMPEGTAKDLTGFLQDLRLNDQAVQVVDAKIERLEKQLNGISYDETVLNLETEIKWLDQRRIELQPEQRALPQRKRELIEKERELSAVAGEIGWKTTDSNDIIEKIPARTHDRLLRDLLNKRMKISDQTEIAVDELNEAEADITRLNFDLEKVAPLVDLNALEASIEYTQREVDSIGNDPSRLRRDIEISDRELRRIQKTFYPPIDDASVLVELHVPDNKTVDEFRNRYREQEIEKNKIAEEINAKKADISEARAEMEQLVAAKRVVTDEDLEHARQQRDETWDALKTFVTNDLEDPKVPSRENPDAKLEELSSILEKQITNADSAADERFANVQSLAVFNEKRNAIEANEDEILALEGNLERLNQLSNGETEKWSTLWGDTPFQLANPDVMATWLDTHNTYVTRYQEREETSVNLNNVLDRERSVFESLAGVLESTLGQVSTRESETSGELLAYARRLVRERTETNTKRKNLENNLNDALFNAEQRRKHKKSLEKTLSAWNEEWETALQQAEYSETSIPQEVTTQLDQFGRLREIISEIENLRMQRIGKIERDLKEFDDQVKVIRRNFPDATDIRESSQVVKAFVERLRVSSEASTEIERLRDAIDEEKQERSKNVDDRETTLHQVNALKTQANVEKVSELQDVIERSDRKRNLLNQLEDLRGLLQEQSDGLTFDQLVEECSRVDSLDAARDEETGLNDVVEDLQEQLQEMHSQSSDLKHELDSMRQADGRTAELEFEKEVAVTEMKEAIERYVPLKASTIVLNWAIEKFQQEKQAPLLMRASEFFETLTEGSFSRLVTDFDGKNDSLLAVRHDGTTVRVQGLSEGTADQLYLALRLSGIENFLEQSNSSLPLIVDDLYTTFDNERARAGLQVLRDLSEKCQILFFTHHEHLVEIAKSVLGDQLTFRSI